MAGRSSQVDSKSAAALAQEVRVIAAAAFRDAIEMLAVVEVLEASNAKPVIDGINTAGAGRAAQIIQNALFVRVHMLVARAYSPSRDNDRHARRAFDLLKNPDVRAEVIASGRESDLVVAEERWTACCGDHRLEPFLHYRDKQIAHLSEPRPGIRTPLYVEVFQLTRATAGALEKLAHGVGVIGLQLEDQVPAYSESASRFWQPWASEQSGE
jgi:hypothetical protein